MTLIDQQKRVCQNVGANFLPTDELLKIGISKDFDPLRFPINGLRHPPERGTTGWYLWSGEDFSDAPDYFVPWKTKHFNERYPGFAKYFGLAPGWRFLIAPR